MLFGNTNAIEPTDAERKRAKEVLPIRQATAAEMVAALQRSAREEPSSVKSVKATSASSSPVPDPVAERHGLYTTEGLGSRHYYADYHQKSEIMRASKFRISSRLDDKQTISAMVDLAEARGWQSVKLSGSESFRREAWVQASVRGVATEAERAADPMHDAAHERRADTHKAEAEVWNSIESRGADAMAHRASLKEKAAVARAAQEEKALAAQATTAQRAA